ncbi:MAG: CoA transferase [Frankiales bacterium]|nr:CoA transferase [Frankiales bacterium]
MTSQGAIPNADSAVDESAAALFGLRVLNLSGNLAGALTGMVLADNGAEVIRVERPGGDPLRANPAFAMWHRGQRSVTVDLTAEAGQLRVRELAAGVDILVQDWRPGVAERLGLSHERLSAANPRLITCSITGFGTRGPYARLKGYEAVVSAKTGFFHGPDRPRFSPIAAASFGAMNGALQGIFAALHQRQSTGVGQRVETSLVQGLSAYDLYGWLEPLVPPERFERTTPLASGPTIYPPIAGISAFTRDGRCLQFGNFLPHQLAAFLRATELTDWYHAHRDQPAQTQTRAVRSRIAEQPWSHWEKVFDAEPDVAAEPYRTPSEATRHPQLIHNGEVVVIDDPVRGPTRQLGPLVALAATPAAISAAAPGLGADNDLELSKLNPSARSKRTSEAPLAGITAVELAWFYAAPFGLALLADLGARVIKVEPITGDPHRSQSGVREFAGVKALQGKESIAVDLLTPEGLEIVRRLTRRADLVMRNFRQSASERMQIDYPDLVRENPDLVYLYAGAYGRSGPSSRRPAYAPTIGVGVGHQARQLGWDRAFDHVEELTVEEAVRRGEDASLRQAHPLVNADAGAALAVGTASVLALLARTLTGQGQYAQTTMLGTNTYVVSQEFLTYAGKPDELGMDDEANGLSALYRLYPTAQGWVFLACLTESEWTSLTDAVSARGRSAFSDGAKFATAALRRAHDEELAQLLAAEFAARTAADWERHLTERDVACVAVSEQPFSEFMIADPSMTANGFVGEVEHPLFGTHQRHGAIVRLGDSEPTLGAAALIGQHTKNIMRELGYRDEEIEDLRARGVISWPND